MSEDKTSTPMMKQYFEIKDAHKDYILFYRMGDFYEMFFDDAVKASAALDIALTKRGKEKGKDIPMCGVPVNNHEMYLSRLIKKGFKVAVCDQMEDPALAKKRGASSCVKREVTRIITPGTITEDTILDARKNNYLLAVAIGNIGELGFAWADMSTGEFVTESAPYAYFSEVVDRVQPKEIILSEKMMQIAELREDLEVYADILTYLPNARFSAENAKQMMQQAFETMTLDAFGAFSRCEIVAAGVLIDYALLTQKGRMPKLTPPRQVADGSVMEIDAATRRNLELFSSLSGERGAKSLFSVIDKTVTGAGARLLATRLASPLTNVGEINVRLDKIEYFLERAEVRRKLRGILAEVGDIERAVSRLALGRGTPRDLAVVRDGLAKIPSISVLFAKSGDFSPEALQKEMVGLGVHTALVDTLEKALASDLPVYAKDGGFIAPRYDEGLDELRAVRDDSKRLIASLQLKYIKESGINSLKITHNNILGYFIEVPAKYGQDLLDLARAGKTPFIHRQSLATTVRFTTDELAALEEKIRGAGEKAIAVELRIFDELVAEVLAKAPEIADATRALSELDVAAGLAEVAALYNYCRPVLDDSLAFEIKGGRHPVVEAVLSEGRTSEFVANDCRMSDTASGAIWLITGPNMAGKSTFLRQNALIAIMAQAGMFVSCSSAKIGVIDRIFSRVGASDDLARGRSTFMVEMVETAAILIHATERSFVILDEIGRGTATFDGLAIAWATLEALAQNNKCRTLFATHYHELTALANKIGMLSLHTMKTKEWQESIVFLYEIIDGSADRSYGIHVAKLAGMPPLVIARAKQVLSELESKKAKVDKLLGDLPLFTKMEEDESAADSKVQKNECEAVRLLRELKPDEMSPKEALETLYRLQKTVEKNE